MFDICFNGFTELSLGNMSLLDNSVQLVNPVTQSHIVYVIIKKMFKTSVTITLITIIYVNCIANATWQLRDNIFPEYLCHTNSLIIRKHT